MSSATLATALSGVGIVASPLLATVAAVFGFSSAALTTFSKTLEKKVTKHEKIYTLAVAKQNSLSDLVSKVLNDNKISDSELSIRLYFVKYKNITSLKVPFALLKINNPGKPQPDIDEIKKQIRRGERQNLQKKYRLWPPSRSWI